MNGLKKFTQVLAGILSVCNWVAMGFMVAMLVLSFFPGDIYTQMFTSLGPNDVSLNSYGYEVVIYTQGAFNLAAVRTFALGAAIVFGLMAMTFHNVVLIIKTMRGEAKNSKGATPFQEGITRMIREIGIYSIIIFGVQFVFSTVASLFLGEDVMGSSFNIMMLMVGLLMICLSSAFEEGEKMQKDVDGLV